VPAKRKRLGDPAAGVGQEGDRRSVGVVGVRDEEGKLGLVESAPSRCGAAAWPLARVEVVQGGSGDDPACAGETEDGAEHR
jgi:hypothetical protein